MGRTRRHLPLEALSGRRSYTPQDHDFDCRRVHAPVLAARTALRLPSHPPLRAARQRSPPEQCRHGTRAVARDGAPGSSRTEGTPSTARITAAYICVQTLRRAHAHHRDLRARPAHPRATGMECFTLSAPRSPYFTVPPALPSPGLAREPLTRRRENPLQSTDRCPYLAPIRIVTPHCSAIRAESAHLIVTSRRTASAQIPIAHRYD